MLKMKLTLAITRCNEISDGGNALGLADPHHFQQQGTPQRGYQGWPEVDGQKTDPGRGRTPNAAVKRPCRAVDRQRKGVDIGIADNAPACIGPFIAVIGNHKKKADVAESHK